MIFNARIQFNKKDELPDITSVLCISQKHLSVVTGHWTRVSDRISWKCMQPSE